MSKTKEIAVLMPVYNPGPDISLTLDSLKKQYVAFKLYVIDDGSAQKPDYASLLAGVDHHLILSPQNIGVNEARNPALQVILQAGHKYIALIDCGDIARPERLKLQKDFLDNTANVDVVGSAIRQVFVVSNIEFPLGFPLSPDDVQRVSWAKLPLSHPTLMLRSDVFRKVGLYSGAFHAAEDYEFARRALKAGVRFANLPDILLDKIETSDSVSHRKRRTQIRSRLAIQWRYRDLSNPLCILGMMRTLLISVTPRSWIDARKKHFLKSTVVRGT
jgi:glycosyltransferase involved in cell wall biosynthesis